MLLFALLAHKEDDNTSGHSESLRSKRPFEALGKRAAVDAFELLDVDASDEDSELNVKKRPFEALGKRALTRDNSGESLSNAKRAFEALGKRSSSRQDKLFKKTNLYKKLYLLKHLLASDGEN